MLPVVASLVAGCAGLPGADSRPAAFDPQDVAWAAKPGKNAIRGSGIVRVAGREPRTCAGAAVAAIPDSPYAQARMRSLYGAVERGANDMSAGASKKIEAADPAYAKSTRQKTCDAKGFFLFEGLPDGVWYVSTAVIWFNRPNDPASQAGTALMQRVTVSGGATVTVTLGQ